MALPTITRNLQPGMSGSDVQSLQQWLKDLGFFPQNQNTTQYYGDITKSAVAAWQSSIGLDTAGYPGYFGPKSIAAMKKIETTDDTNKTSTPTESTSSTDNTKTEEKVNANDIALINGRYAIARLTGDPTSVYLIDQTNKTIQKFESNSAIANYRLTSTTYEDLVSNGELQTAPLNDLLQKGYKVADTIKNDGTDPLITNKVANWDPVTTYGKTITTAAGESAIAQLKSLYKLAVSGGVASQATINAATANSTFAKHVAAMVAGGYTIEDIMKDLKRLDLISKGNTSLADTQVISANQDRSTYYSTQAGKSALANTTISIPSTIGGLNAEEMKLPIAQLSDETFKILTPILDPTSAEFADAASKVNTLFLDHTQHALEAKTEQDKQVAETQWLKDKAEIERLYKINLSNDISTAWTQFQNLSKNASAANLSGSGLEREDQDKILAATREQEEQRRITKANELETEDMTYAINNATAEENAKLSDAQLEKYGLKPSQDILDYYTKENLKKLNPGASDAYIQAMIDSVIDTSTGKPMYRSKLYQTLYTNRFNTLMQKEKVKMDEVFEANKKAQAEAARKIGLTTDTFSSALPGDSDTTSKMISESTTPTSAVNTQEQTPASNVQTPQTPVKSALDPYGTGRIYSPNADLAKGFYAYNQQGGITWVPGTVETTKTSSASTSPVVQQNTVNKTTPTPEKPSGATSGTNGTVNTATSTVAAAKAASNLGTQSSSTPAKSTYSGSSLVDYLKSVGKDSSYSGRDKLAKEYGITNYTRSAEQNTQLLKKLRGY